MSDPWRWDPNRREAPLESLSQPEVMLAILASILPAILLAIVLHWVEGTRLLVAVVALVVLIPLLGLGLKAAMTQQDKRRYPRPEHASLPPDSELSVEQRHEAMQEYADELHHHRE